MPIPNFHDGYFDGIWIGPNNLVYLFLRRADHQSLVLGLAGVERLTFAEIKQGNIILDLVFRGAGKITQLDIAELYGVDADSPQCVSLVNDATERQLQVLEVNPSYGAKGLALFHSWDITQREVQP
jgi:hypothetical protein